MQWQNSFGGEGIDNLYELKQTTDGGFIRARSSNSDSSGNKTKNICIFVYIVIIQ